MTLKLIAPILKLLKSGKELPSPAPSVEVTAAAEMEYYQQLRAQMKLKVWEKDGGVVRWLLGHSRMPGLTAYRASQSWYVDPETRLCVVSFQAATFPDTLLIKTIPAGSLYVPGCCLAREYDHQTDPLLALRSS